MEEAATVAVDMADNGLVLLTSRRRPRGIHNHQHQEDPPEGHSLPHQGRRVQRRGYVFNAARRGIWPDIARRESKRTEINNRYKRESYDYCVKDVVRREQEQCIRGERARRRGGERKEEREKKRQERKFDKGFVRSTSVILKYVRE